MLRLEFSPKHVFVHAFESNLLCLVTHKQKHPSCSDLEINLKRLGSKGLLARVRPRKRTPGVYPRGAEKEVERGF